MHRGGALPAMAIKLLGIAHRPSPTSRPAPTVAPSSSADAAWKYSHMCMMTDPSQKSMACTSNNSKSMRVASLDGKCCAGWSVRIDADHCNNSCSSPSVDRLNSTMLCQYAV
eukprot:GHUV01052860.1.p1 GENE.GHUV01052860.1~~GHUV01052860.1.p1  ORF type:complete len:112 (+),score=15.84 GHUV01052860.1:297-632(+)